MCESDICSSIQRDCSQLKWLGSNSKFHHIFLKLAFIVLKLNQSKVQPCIKFHFRHKKVSLFGSKFPINHQSNFLKHRWSTKTKKYVKILQFYHENIFFQIHRYDLTIRHKDNNHYLLISKPILKPTPVKSQQLKLCPCMHPRHRPPIPP